LAFFDLSPVISETVIISCGNCGVQWLQTATAGGGLTHKKAISNISSATA
jgi:hypothetical protein